jgi:AraC-like DNA-binding protein
MEIELINQHHIESLECFKNPSMKRGWDILIMVVSGTYSLFLEGKKKPLVLKEHEIAFIPANTEFHRIAEDFPTYYHISFHADAEHPFRRDLAPCKLSLPKEQAVPIFNSMERAFPIPDNRELIIHLVERILTENYLFGKSPKEKFPHMSEEVLNTVRYMNRHLDEPLDIETLATRVYLSHSGLIWKFKRELGTTPSQYLILLRLRYAKQLLLNHPYNINEISEMCGYTNPFYFTNAFHRYAGMSPTEFRKYYLEGTTKDS